MPPSLARKAVASALRVQQRPANQWLGFMHRDFAPNGELVGWQLEPHAEDKPSSPTPKDGARSDIGAGWRSVEGRAGSDECGGARSAARSVELRNVLLVAQAAVGGSIRWGRWDKFVGEPTGAAVVSYLNPDFTEWWSAGEDGVSRLESTPVAGEATLLGGWDAGDPPPPAEPRVQRLDEECRLAAFDPLVAPSSLLLLQALLPEPPASWKKHALPSLARQVRKLRVTS